MLRSTIGGLALALFTSLAAPAMSAIVYTGSTSFAGNATDLSGMDPAFGGNRLSIGSDLWYDSKTNSYWGNTDRGPGGGLIDFAPASTIFRSISRPMAAWAAMCC